MKPYHGQAANGKIMNKQGNSYVVSQGMKKYSNKPIQRGESGH